MPTIVSIDLDKIVQEIRARQAKSEVCNSNSKTNSVSVMKTKPYKAPQNSAAQADRARAHNLLKRILDSQTAYVAKSSPIRESTSSNK